MNRLLRLAVRLYPSWWRRRYAREFEALLEDVTPGWYELFDVLKGALTMRITTLGTIPVACALAGAVVGGIVALRTPEVFASSATIRLKEPDLAKVDSTIARELRASLDKTLDRSSASLRATSVTLHRDHSAQATLKLTYQDRDLAQAKRVAERLTAAIATESSQRAALTEVLDAPGLPASPIGSDYPMHVASGGGVGLVAGGALLLLLRLHRRSASAP